MEEEKEHEQCDLDSGDSDSIEDAYSDEDELEEERSSDGVGKLLQDLEDLLHTGQESDVTVKVRDKEFKVHKVILAARSPVFATMFQNDLMDKGSGILDINDCDPKTFQEFLSYLYTGKLENHLSRNSACPLYHVADKYQMNEMKTECANFMMLDLCSDTLFDVALLAVRYKDSDLLNCTAKYFARRMERVLASDAWKTFKKEHPEEANKLHEYALNSQS